MPLEFDPHRDTDASVGQQPKDDPFDDWPTRSLTDPIGEIQGYGRLSRAVSNAGPGWRRSTGRVLALLMLAFLVLGVVLGSGQMILGG
ncbi:MAG: hypothetical protein KY457_07365 [Actinobacteria bacterium]|nr:hypothetical protein [Actinomycetota bacterium]